MARVESGASGAEQMKKQITRQVEVDIRKMQRRKKMIRCGSCLFLVVLFFAALAGFIAWAMAASGMYQVPFFSSWAFNEPEPIHRVVIEDDFEDVEVLERMRTQINNLITTENPGQLRLSEASVTVDEELITAYLNQNIASAAEQANAEIIRAQVAVEPKGMEIFVHMIRNDKPIYIRLLIIPEVIENDINLNIIDARLGNLPIPTWAAGYALNTLMGSALSVLQVPVVGFVHLSGIDLIYGKLVLNGSIEYTTFK